MQRWISLGTLFVLAAAAATLVALEASTAPPAAAAAQTDAEEAPEEPEENSPPPEDAPEETVVAPSLDASARAVPHHGNFDVMADGSAVPALSVNAPLKVKIGIALFRYEGAQGAGSTKRSRQDALAQAKAALEGGKDFGQIVGTADPGSSVDVGWIQRGVLERAVEFAIFSLEKGATVSEPIDTPRGYWIVRRIR